MTSCLLDTNIILRFILKDHPTLSPKANNIILHHYCHIDDIVIAEVVWVLSSTYQQLPAIIAHLLKDFLTNDTIKVQNLSQTLHALNLYEAQRLSYIDCWLVVQAQSLNLPLKTFDTKLQKLAASRTGQFSNS
jgi:predicted nucleic-acid-binding protein